MKKYLAFFTCLILACSLLAQEKYPIPVRSGDQKHSRMVYQYWALTAGGINFAKSHGVTPYDYGKYVGNMFAPSWGAGNNFEAYVKGMIANWESMRLATDPGFVVKEEKDGSVIVSANEKILHRYFPEGKGYSTFNEFIEYFRGVGDPIADYMGAKVQLEIKDTLIIFTMRKKQ
jgi:hypothetical protein